MVKSIKDDCYDFDNNIVFVFDLDGTLTKNETLPVIARYFGIEDEISKLTAETVKGNIPFIESFIKRVNILKDFSISEINNLLRGVDLFSKIVDFIKLYKSNCYIATGNFDGWVSGLIEKIGCKYFASEGFVKDDQLLSLKLILNKKKVVEMLQASGKKVVFIGDGNNDAEAMRVADISIACGLVHYPSKSIMNFADYAIFEEEALCRLLKQIHILKSLGKSIILSCAGIGSRLGLGKTKALIEINSKSLIDYQLSNFKNIEDIRIVIGYQANEVISAALSIRKDIIFVFNHDYFHTKTGASFYLGARHANEYLIAWDGDLLVHPEDIGKCLNYDGEYIGCSDIVSDEPVYVIVNENNECIAFSRDNGDFEWVGPACFKKEKLRFVTNNVYNLFESELPIPILRVRARDIDTYDDYIRAKNFVGEWSNE
ncbi:HAD-IB family phosphatase [Francisella tularensis]|uniref:HAD-IB family phosphatase n=1 Tax=Francisella tularensis TaxID=263 RepID=UPI0000F5909E|nr:HAD-IB family phosphatase [Francisella tularensis]ABO46499.1 hydrolase/phosphatase, HAD family [Francisella tularensis subsp. tularensis WY96-3418]AJI63682.1 HAD phosphoserine phosphatase-like hydrolase, IB family protein [Francisella tularensis subsp. tularensis]AKH91637.1 hydrolase [Francisella tularensis subsp. tularensis WY-00W4114]AKU73279.1 HAD phosphoserine phosphatase-like hydrolase, IB family protein [Francisella tularensis subsp. tularensis]EKM87777.1 HAD superfamily hydrolase/pho